MLSWHQPLPTVAPPRDPPKGWSVAPVPPADRKRIALELAAMLALIAVPGLLIGIDGIGEPRSVSTDLSALELLATLAGSGGAAALAAQLLWRDGRLAVAGFNRRSPGFVIGYGALGLVCTYGALIATAIVSAIVFTALGGDVESFSNGTEDAVELSAASLAVAYVLSLSAGITEEILFRAYAITRLEELGWKRAAWIVPGVVFTLLHLYQGVFAIVTIGAVTAVFTWLWRWKRSLLPLMVAHAAFDTVQFTIAALVGG